MGEPKRYAVTASTIEEALGALARVPGMLIQAFTRWKRIRLVIEEAEDVRTLDQNRLQRLWCKEAAQQGDCDAEWYRGYCKYHFGIAILCRDSEAYRDACKRVLGSLGYEQRIELMMEPHDYPVTRGMTKAQKTEYLDRCWQHFTGLGMRLTDPGLKGINPHDYREVA